MRNLPRRNRRIIEEAAAWATLLDDGDLPVADREKLAIWLRESPQHVKELLLAKAITTEAESIDPDRTISIDDLLADQGADVVSIGPAAESPTAATVLGKSARPIGVAASLLVAAAAIAFLTTGPFSPSNTPEELAYTTAIGEQRSLSLDDGSIVHLNTLSKVRIRYVEEERAIDLLEGEALFDVAHDPDRPFRVHAGGSIAEAIGTTFNVHLIGDDAEVAVIEGQVTVTAIRGAAGQHPTLPESGNVLSNSVAGNRITLSVGETAAIDASGSLQAVRASNLEAVAAWRLRQLVFEDASLTEIAGEFNRYNRTKMQIQGDETMNPRFSGVFDADDPDAFLSILKVSGTARIDHVRPDRVVVHLMSAGDTE